MFQIKSDKIKGFTLLELIIALLLTSILLFFASDVGSDLLVRNQSEVEADKLIRAIQFARMNAIQLGKVVTLCKSADRKTCSGNWSSGQIIFVDLNEDAEINGEDQILRVISGVDKRSILEWHGFINDDYLQFRPSLMNQAAGGSFIFCQKNELLSQGWRLIINRIGRWRIDPMSACG